MLRAGFVLLVALVGFDPPVPGEGHKDFSGTWKMDVARSESAHQGGPVESSVLVIRLTDTSLTIETTRSSDDKPSTFHETLKLRLDGSETTGTGDSGVRVTGKARWDGPKLVVETVRDIQGSTVTTLYVHELSPNGREMTIDKTLTVQHGYQGSSASNTGHGKDVFVRVAK